jgi:hypothetical protein
MRLQASREAILGEKRRPSPWRPLAELRDRTLPKLDNLKRAARAGISVPEPIIWAYAADFESSRAPDPGPTELLDMPCIVRSISPTEDTKQGSQAGRFLSLVVNCPSDFPGAVARVLASLPVRDGRRLGAVAV